MNKEGKLIWITGLSGAGKTTIAKKVYEILKQQNPNIIVHLDGDDINSSIENLTYYPNIRFYLWSIICRRGHNTVKLYT